MERENRHQQRTDRTKVDQVKVVTVEAMKMRTDRQLQQQILKKQMNSTFAK
jgi:hypothetical protein